MTRPSSRASSARPPTPGGATSGGASTQTTGHAVASKSGSDRGPTSSSTTSAGSVAGGRDRLRVGLLLAALTMTVKFYVLLC